MIYALVVLMKLYISATTPGEIANVINEKDLRLEQSLERLEAVFEKVVERDQLSPHTKFLYVIQRLGERLRNIKRSQGQKAEPKPSKMKQEQKASPAKTSPTSAPPRPRANSRPMSASESLKPQGLHLLSEAAVNNASVSPMIAPIQALPGTHSVPVNTPMDSSNTPLGTARRLPSSAASTPATMSHRLPQQLPPQPAQWYAPQGSPVDAMVMQGMDNDQLFDFPGQFGGVEDFGLAGLGMDGVTGLLMDNSGIWGGFPMDGGFFAGGWTG